MDICKKKVLHVIMLYSPISQDTPRYTTLPSTTESGWQRGEQRRQGMSVHLPRNTILFRDTFLTLQVLDLAADVLKHVPDTIDYEATYKLVVDDMSPLNVVLLQEVGTLCKSLS